MNVLHGHVMTGGQCTTRARDDQVNVNFSVMNEHTRFIAAVDKSKQSQTDLFHDVCALLASDIKHSGQNMQHVIPGGVVLIAQASLGRSEHAQQHTLLAEPRQL